MAKESENVLELELFEANSFMGIDKTRPVVIDFTKRKKNQNVIEFFGDQGQGKSSTLMGILFAMGASFSIDKKKLVNHTYGEIDINFKFSYNDEQYHVIANSNRTELKKYMPETGKWKKPEDGSPMELLRKIFGPVGMSPFGVREMKGKDQIKFFQQMFGTGEDATKKIKKLEGDIDTLFNQRRDVNRDMDRLKKVLDSDELYNDYENSQKKFKTAINVDKEKKAHAELLEKNNKYIAYKNNTLPDLRERAKRTDETVARLERELAEAKNQKTELDKKVADGEKWLADNKNIPADFEKANDTWTNLSKEIAKHEKWKETLKTEKEYNALVEGSTAATAQLEELRTQLLKETKKCLPKVEGLSIKVATGLDKTDQLEGVFYNDQPIHELSESEYTELWCLIFDAAGINFLFLENISSFGSQATSTFNQLAKNGALIFATRMDQSKKDIGIAFKAKL